MSSLEDRLRKALDRDPPKGWWSLLRRSPADEGRLIARGREDEVDRVLGHTKAAKD